MAFQNSLSGRMEELRFPSLRSPETDSFPSNGPATSRGEGSFFPNTNNDTRGGLQRRFTTDASKMSMSRPFGTQFNNQPQSGAKQKMMDDILSAKRLAEEQLRLLELQERRLQMGPNGDESMDTITNRLNRASLNGPVSEPTTPPEYADGIYASRYSRGSRMSTSSIMSPPGLGKRFSQASNHTGLISPSATRLSGSMYAQAQQSAKSVPASRRGSDEEEDYADALPNIRQPTVSNRFSMPVGSSRPLQSHRFSVGQVTNRNGFDLPINTSFLEDSDYSSLSGLDLKSPIAKTFAALEGDDTFPTLTSNGLKLSANSAALDLAKSKSPDGFVQLDGADWSIGSRYRPSHQSMPHNDSSMYRPVLSNISSPSAERSGEPARRKSQRHSMGVTFEEGPKYDNTPLPPTLSRPASLQTSYSTNDVPTVRKSLTLESISTPTKTADQQFRNHNMSLGRIPASAGGRQSRDFDNSIAPQSGLQASAAPFGPGYTAESNMGPSSTYNQASTYGFNNGTYNMNGANGQASTYGQGGFANGTSTYANAFAKSQELSTTRANGANGNGRRNFDEARYNNVPIDTYRGRLFELCKDQHGCRYLQRKLEEGDAEQMQMIFSETYSHIIELMTDPFGNYLCQKLFEHCNEEQRITLIKTAAPALHTIATNQHGTRALQKMIEFLHTGEQVQMIIEALDPHVVNLVQDLNGNHVIQKCLTRLGAEQSQFIYDAVARYCVVVGTHRHGCCVLQRCIDHSQGQQRAQLIAQITKCAFELVQDPFGNYVVQYILDLDEATFTTPLCHSFAGRVVSLSKQKFSSNVIEKCIRTADMDTKRGLVREMMISHELERMLRDSFANYVVQTALDFLDEKTKTELADGIRPILPSIKSTPHGRRIASKIMALDQGRVPPVNEHVNSNPFANPLAGGMAAGGLPAGGMSTGRASGRRQIQIVGGGFNGPRGGSAPNNTAGYAFPDPPTDHFANNNGYAPMPNMQGAPMNQGTNGMFPPQTYGYPNGQMGNGFI